MVVTQLSDRAACLPTAPDENVTEPAELPETLGPFARVVAHDFNNLLTAILSYADFVAESIAGDAHRVDENPDQHAALLDDVAQITRAAERATRLTRKLLAFGRDVP